MSEYLMRDAAPFGADVWAKIDGMVVDVVKKNLVARRFLEFVGPLGWGTEVVPMFGFGSIDEAAVVSETASYVPMVELAAKFMLRARQLAVAEQTSFGIDLGAVAIAATKLAQAEDKLILGELMSKAKTESALGEWDTMGGPFKAVAQAMAALRQNGCDGPYRMIMSPGMYARLAGLMQHGRREAEMVEKLVGGVLQSVLMPEDQFLLVSPQAWNMDLVVGQDIATAYVGNEGLDHRFRIFETLVLRLKRPEAVCLVK